MLAERLGIPIVATGRPVPGRRPRRDAAAARGAPSTWTQGSSSRTTSWSACCSTASAGTTPSDGVILDGFPRTAIQADALDEALDGRRGGVAARRRSSTSPIERADRAHVGPLGVPRCRHPYHETSSPPAVAGRVRPGRLRALPARRRQARDRPRRGWPSSWGARRGHRPLPESGDLLAVNGEQVDRRGRRDIAVGAHGGGVRRRRSGRAGVITHQVEGRHREDAGGRPDRGRGPRAGRGAPEPGV